MAARRPRLAGADRLRPDRDRADPDLQPARPRPPRQRRRAGRRRRAADRAAGGSADRPSARQGRRDGGRDPGQGEIQARGPNVFEGYWHNPEATAREPSPPTGSSAPAISATSTPSGYLHIVGRSKELIVLAGGKNIFPEEVEAVYGESPLIHELAVLEQSGRLVGLIVPEIEALRGRRRGAAPASARRDRAALARACRRTSASATSRSPPRPCRAPRSASCAATSSDAIFERAKAGAAAPRAPAELSARDRALLEFGRARRGLALARGALRAQAADPGHQPAARPRPRFVRLDEPDHGARRALRRAAQRGRDRPGRRRCATCWSRSSRPAARPAGRRPRSASSAPSRQRWLQPRGCAIRALAAVLFALNRALHARPVPAAGRGPRASAAPTGPICSRPITRATSTRSRSARRCPGRSCSRLYWAGWTGLLFRGPLTRLFSRAAQVLPVDPERGLTSTLPLASAALERGNALCWFPEGARSTDGRLHRFLPGAGLLIERTGVPAVPVFIGGSFEAWPPGRTLPRLRPLLVRFGRADRVRAPRARRRTASATARSPTSCTTRSPRCRRRGRLAAAGGVAL